MRRLQRGATGRENNAVLNIPLVVHLVHDDGPENLTDEQVKQAIEWLNQGFANSGAYARGTGTDTKIRFCLAQRDPQNQPTTGINRMKSAMTQLDFDKGDAALKKGNWPARQYCNLWVVRDICSEQTGCGISGYGSMNYGGPTDGVVMEAEWLFEPEKASVLVHELGHYFGLFHTYEFGCNNGDCLTDGDRVCDTPPDQSAALIPCDVVENSCSTDIKSGFKTDVPDLRQNFMDYGNTACWHDFTPGQIARMRDIIVNRRNSLLVSRGGCFPPCKTAGDTPPIPSFKVQKDKFFAGDTIFLTNQSQNAADFQWSVNGIIISNETDAQFVFQKTGVYTIKLKAFSRDSSSCNATTDRMLINVGCNVVANFNFFVEEKTLKVDNLSVNANQYSWYVNGRFVGKTWTNAGLSPGLTYVIQIEASNGFCRDTFSRQIVYEAFFISDNCTKSAFQYTYPTGLNISQLTALSDGTFVLAANVSNLAGGNFQLMNLTPNGKQVWANNLYNWRQCVSLCPLTNGGFAAIIDNGANLSAFSTDGRWAWSKTFTPSEQIAMQYLSGGSDGTFYAAGFQGVSQQPFISRWNQKGEMQWMRQLPKPHYILAIKSVQQYALVLRATISTRVPSQYLITCIDQSGNIAWNKQVQFPGDIKPKSSARLGANPENGEIWLDIDVDNTQSVLCKISLQGELLMAQSMALKAKQSAFTTALAPLCLGNGVILARTLRVTNGSSSKSNILLTRVDADGQLLWSRLVGNSLASTVASIAPLPDDQSFLIGGFAYTSTAGNVQRGFLQKISVSDLTNSCLEPLQFDGFTIQPIDILLSSSNLALTESSTKPIDRAVGAILPSRTKPDTICMQICRPRTTTAAAEPELPASCTLASANAFSPNDDGLNDRFYPIADACICRVTVFQILNRQGQVVFEQRNIDPNQPESGWDGRFRNRALPSGVYFWRAVLERCDGTFAQQSGDVALMR